MDSQRPARERDIDDRMLHSSYRGIREATEADNRPRSVVRNGQVMNFRPTIPSNFSEWRNPSSETSETPFRRMHTTQTSTRLIVPVAGTPPENEIFKSACERWFAETLPQHGFRETAQQFVDKIFDDNFEIYCVFLAEGCLWPTSSIDNTFLDRYSPVYGFTSRLPLVLDRRTWALHIFNPPSRIPMRFTLEYTVPKYSESQLQTDAFGKSNYPHELQGRMVTYPGGIKYYTEYIFHTAFSHVSARNAIPSVTVRID